MSDSSWPVLGRRAALTGLVASAPGLARATPVPVPHPTRAIRLGILPFGSVQWVADVIAHHGLDLAHGFTLATVRLASTEAGKVALLGGGVDVAWSDWPFIAAQRAHGGHLCFAAGGSAGLGGIMVPASSKIRGLADLAGMRLGVAGGAGDKSWLVVQAAGRSAGLDLAAAVTLSFGAPPLLDSMLRHGALDALLTFWNFAARLEAAGFREAVPVVACARTLGLAQPPTLLGYVFDEVWARESRPTIDGFLAAAWDATTRLATTPAEWARIRPLMDAPDDALFDALRRRFIAGIRRPTAPAMLAEATRLQAAFASIDPHAAGATLPASMFWPGQDAG